MFEFSVFILSIPVKNNVKTKRKVAISGRILNSGRINRVFDRQTTTLCYKYFQSKNWELPSHLPQEFISFRNYLVCKFIVEVCQSLQGLWTAKLCNRSVWWKIQVIQLGRSWNWCNRFSCSNFAYFEIYILCIIFLVSLFLKC